MSTKYVGNRYGSLVVVKPINFSGRRKYDLVCDCGEHRVALIGSVVHGTVRSCKSCTVIRVSEANRLKATKHGLSSSGLYTSWKCMKSRCKDKVHAHYTKLDISYCEEWELFEGFRDWAMTNGWKEGLTIDRIDPAEGYYPTNCQWLTREENTARANRGRTPWNKQ